MDEKFKFKFETSLEDIRQQIILNRNNNNNNQNPRNTFLDLVDGISKISSKFRGKTDDECNVGLSEWSDEQRKSLEISIIETMNTLITLSNDCRIDLSDAVVKKMAQNDQKYPVNKAYGLAKKYNEL